MWEEIFARTMLLMLSMGVVLALYRRNCNLKIPFWALCLFWEGKILLINIGWNLVLAPYSGTLWYAGTSVVLSALYAVVLIWMTEYCFVDSKEKTVCIYFVAEMVMCTGLWGSLWLLGQLSGKSVSTIMSHLDGLVWLEAAFQIGLIFLFSWKKVRLFGCLKNWKPSHPRIIWILYILIQIIGFIGAVLVFVMREDFTLGYMAMPVAGILVLIAGVILYQHMEQTYLYRENQSLHLQQQLIREYNDTLKEQIELTRKLRHDIGNHMQTLETLAAICGERPEFKAYADSLRQQYHLLQRTSYCKNMIVDAVLCNKIRLCRREGIEAQIDIRSLELGEIEEKDILVVLYNLLDNGIESCRRVREQEPGKRVFLELTAENRASQLILKMRNSASGMEHAASGRGIPATSKKDRKRHGIGMQILKDVAEKYNGQMRFQGEKEVFSVLICLGTIA